MQAARLRHRHPEMLARTKYAKLGRVALLIQRLVRGLIARRFVVQFYSSSSLNQLQGYFCYSKEVQSSSE